MNDRPARNIAGWNGWEKEAVNSPSPGSYFSVQNCGGSVRSEYFYPDRPRGWTASLRSTNYYKHAFSLRQFGMMPQPLASLFNDIDDFVNQFRSCTLPGIT